MSLVYINVTIVCLEMSLLYIQVTVNHCDYVLMFKLLSIIRLLPIVIAGITSGAGGGWAPLTEILEEQKFESTSEENYKRKTSTI